MCRRLASDKPAQMAKATSGPPAGRRIDDLLDDRYLLDALLEHSPDHLYFKDRQSRFVRISRSLAEWIGLRDPVDAIGRSDDDFFAPEHARKAKSDEAAIMRDELPVVGIEECEVWPDGRRTWVSTTKVPLRDRSNTIIGVFGMSRDITARKEAEELVAAQSAMLAEQARLLHELATRDELTGLLNRRGFFDEAECALAAARAGSRQAAMIFVDLDGLKQLNDAHGHIVGDRALIAVADALRAVANEHRIAGRIGGDEFCVLETGPTNAPRLDEATLQAAISATATRAGVPDLSASIGKVEAAPTDALRELIADSDTQMYARKARRATAPDRP